MGRAAAWAMTVVILDEPTSHLGARQAGEVLEVMTAATGQGLGVIVIGHPLAHVLRVTDRVVVRPVGEVGRDAPTWAFDVDRRVGTVTGLPTGSWSAVRRCPPASAARNARVCPAPTRRRLVECSTTFGTTQTPTSGSTRSVPGPG